jgi:uncharacterized repeat protein (TIGR01451 family)
LDDADTRDEIVINDPQISNVTCVQPPFLYAPASGLSPTTMDCTGTFAALDQADIDAGEFTNTATASFTYVDPTGAETIITSPEASEAVTADITPGFTFEKSAPTPATFSALNEAVTFTFSITNTSTQTIAQATVTDSDIPSLSCTLTDIGPAGSATETASCTGDYAITQVDMDAGTFTNEASATGTSSTGITIPAQTDTATVILPAADRNESLTFDKIASNDTFAAVDDEITYVFSVFNDGNVTLTDIVVVDTPLRVNCTIPTLAVGDTDAVTCEATKVITQNDIDNGSFVNDASATSAGGATDADMETATGPTRAPAFTFLKSTSDSFANVGDMITFSFAIENTGNVTLTDVVVTDTFFAPTLICTIATIAAGDTDSTTCSASYEIDQDDLNAGEITNMATVTANSLQGPLTPKDSTVIVNAQPEVASVFIDKVETDGNGLFGAEGTFEGYGFTITNTGLVTLRTVEFSDPLTGLTCAVDDIEAGQSAVACSNGTLFADSYQIQQSDVDLGTLTNVVTVTATTTQGTNLSDDDTVVLNGPVQAPAISMVKTSTAGVGFDMIGDRIDYSYAVTNDGNITITEPITIADDRVNVTCDPLPLAGLAPLGVVICTATDTVDQADLDVGKVTNVATATVVQPVVPSPLHPTGVATVPSNEETVEVLAIQEPELSILKRVKAGTPSTYDATTDIVTYEFVVTNEGNVTTTDQITVEDLLIPASVPCGPAIGGIAPGGTVTCEATWSPEQSDIDTGEFLNSATASMPFDGGTTTTLTPAEVTVYAVQQPAMTVVKTYRDGSLSDFSDTETATYDYLITNTGNQTIVGQITIEDNLIAAVDCTASPGDLAPGGTMSCEGSYQLDVTDIQLGSVTNLAFAKSTTIDSETTSETIPAGGVPAMTITKVADVSTFTKAGDLITYTYTVTNTSTGSPASAFANPITIQDDKFPAGLACWESTTIGPDADPDVRAGETVTCTPAAVYTVTQADMDALRADPAGPTGTLLSTFVKNTANGQTIFGTVDVVSAPVSVLVDGVADPSLDVEKDATSPDSPAVVGSIVTYTINVTNDGNQTISGIVVDDPMLDVVTCEIGGVAAPANLILAPMDIAICTGTYEVAQGDVDAQVLENTVTVTGSDPTGEPLSEIGTETYPLDPLDTGVEIVKSLAAGTPALAYSTVGQQIVYDIAVTNTGNVTLTSTVITDILFPGQVCNIAALAPMAVDTDTCKFTYRVTQDDIDNGEIVNTATATSQPATPNTNPITDDSTIEAQGPVRAASARIVKVADVSDFAAASLPIVYTYTIINNGNVTLEIAPTVTDDKIVAPNAVTCDAFPSGGLAPTEELVCRATYQTTQLDVNNGGVTNIADVSVPNPLGGAPLTDQASLTVDATQAPTLNVTKVASDTTQVVAGQTITYTYVVTNTGNVTQTNVTLSDAHTTQAGTIALPIANNVIATMLPNASVTRTATYRVTQADIDAGGDLTNTVTATGTSPTGVDAPTPATADEVVAVQTADPSIEAVKTVGALPAMVMEGTIVNFTITVENTGNVSLDDITLVDTLRRADGTAVTPALTPVYDSGDTDVIGDMEVGETWTYKLNYALTQADIDAGGINNSVRALGTDPFDTTVSDISNNNTGAGSSPTVVPITPNPSLEATKRITANPVTLGATLRFEIDVENTGNVTLSAVAVIDTLTRADNTVLTPASGPSFFMADEGSPVGTLTVGETATYRVTYVLTQDDIDAGGIENTASAVGTPPIGSQVLDAVNTPVVLPIIADPTIDMVKTLKSGGPTFDAVNEVLTYTFTITNTGNVTLKDAFTVTDPLITNAGGAIVCEPAPLAPLDSLICEGSYAVTQDDIDAGNVDNTATASNVVATSDPSATSTPAQQNPAMETVKKAATITVDGTTYTDIKSEYFVTGAVVGYTYTVTNTGNQTLTDAITVSDNRIASVSCPALPTGGLAPTDNIVCTANYTVTSTDVRLTSVTNAATATSGTVVSPIVTETIPADGEPLLTIAKSLSSVMNPNGSIDPSGTFDEVGDVLTYSFSVTNDGTVAYAKDVTVEDALLAAPLVCFASTGSDPDLRSDETVTCEGTYTIDQDDLDAGEVFNEAIAQTLFGADDTPVISDPDTVTTDADADPALTIAKSVATLPVTAVNQLLTYTLTLTNEGNQTLTSVVATDPLIPTLSCTIASMDPDAVETCMGQYRVQQSDIDAGALVNTASVTGVTPNGSGVDDDTSLTTAMPAAAPDLRMTKVGSPDPFGAVGSAVTYVFTLTNMGNVTLYDLNITDAIVDPAYSCTVAELGVGNSDSSCSLSYEVTQDDKDTGEILNVATVTGRDPFTPITPVEARSDVDSEPADPSLQVTKTASLGGSVAGAVVTFDLFVENTGDVTLTVDTITDTMTRADGTSISLTTPFSYLSGDTDGDDKLDVDETWRYQGARTITLDDVNAGGFQNSARVFGTDPFGTDVSDISDDGDDLDGNTGNDPTVVDIVPGPAIDTVKTLLSAGSTAGAEVVFQISATNIGNVTLTDVTPTDALRRADGTAIDPSFVTITQTAGAGTSFEPIDVWTWSATYTLTQADVDAGGLVNTASVTGTPPTGNPVTDISDNGNDTDGNTTDDETTLTITSAPAFDVVKTVVPFADDTLVQAGEVVTFNIAVANNGNVTLNDLVLTDTLTRSDGEVLIPDSITLTQGAADTQVEVGETLIFTVLYTLTQADVDAGGIENTATADVTTPSGVPLTDTSDDGDDTDGNTLNDPTVVPITQVSAMTATKEASTPERIRTDLSQVVFTITVENTGNVSQTNLVINDDLIPFVTPASLSGAQTAVLSGFDGTGGVNRTYNGNSVINLVTANVDLLPGSVGTILLTVTYDTSGGNYPSGTNTVEVISDLLTAGIIATAQVIQQADPDIIAIKTVTPSDVMLGDTVTYTLTFENRLDTTESNLTVVDDMPVGVLYTPGSARFNGSETPEPAVIGRQLRWNDLTMSPRQLITITFDARVVGERGEMINRAYMLDGSGNVVSNIAEATITRRPEAVFECADIIGTVFDDRNMNGYQDGAVEPDNRAVTDQTFAGGKGKLAPAREIDTGSPHEPGLPNARLATVNGTIITTDEYGRFSVPCAELPASIGSNFTLKLDERSLPTGYRVTTENPRVIRVTPGTAAKLNFGAAISNVVDIDLMASAFQLGTDAPTAALIAGVDQLVRQLRDVPSVLRLSYYMNGEARSTVRTRLDMVEELIRDRWRDNGRYRLLIERTIRQMQ